MPGADPDAPSLRKFVRIPVLGQTWGKACNDEYADKACPFLEVVGDDGRCLAFDVGLATDDTMEIGLWARTERCLSADGSADAKRENV